MFPQVRTAFIEGLDLFEPTSFEEISPRQPHYFLQQRFDKNNRLTRRLSRKQLYLGKEIVSEISISNAHEFSVENKNRHLLCNSHESANGQIVRVVCVLYVSYSLVDIVTSALALIMAKSFLGMKLDY
jgi:hypothetical protein